MDAGTYAGGALLFAFTLAAVIYAAETVRRRRFAELAGAPSIAARTILISCSLALAVLIPGVLRVLSPGTVAGCAVLLALASRLIPGTATRLERTPEREPPDRVGSAIALAAVIVVGAVLVGQFLHAVATPVTAVDLISADLPVIGRWIQTGSIWHFTELFPYQSHGTYPHNAHLLLTAVILPFHNDALVRFLSYPFLPLAAIAMYATGRELGAPRATATVFAAMFTAVPTVAMDIEIAPPDTISLALFAAGLLFLMRHARTRETSDVVLAGLGLGFAAGGMWYFSSAVLVLALAWAAWSVLGAGASRAGAARQAALCIGVIAATSAFWLVRNLVVTGDPIYPVRVAVGGVTIFPAPFDVYRHMVGFSIADYLGNGHVLGHYILPALRKSLALPGLLAVAGAIWTLAVTVPRRRRRDPEDRRLAFLAAVAVPLAVLYVLTPYSALGSKDVPSLAWVNVRYAIPAITLAVPVTAVMAGRAGRLRHVVEAAALVATAQGMRGAYYILGTGRRSLFAGVAAALLVAGVVGSWYVLRARERPPRLPGWALLGSAGLAALLCGYAVQRRLNHQRYGSFDATYLWVQHHPGAQKIGLAGSFNFAGLSPAWPMFGSRLQNPVTFVGRIHDGQVSQFSSRAAWLAALRRGGYDLVEIARNPAPAPMSNHELRWAAGAGLPVVSESPFFELARVPVNP